MRDPADVLSIIIIALFWVGILGLWIGSLVWVYRDAQERKNMGCLICLLVFLTWPWGLLLWVLLRPEHDYYQ